MSIDLYTAGEIIFGTMIVVGPIYAIYKTLKDDKKIKSKLEKELEQDYSMSTLVPKD